jgi:hypothetical protein
MVTFLRIGEFGRLGNQLFQYAILLAVAYLNKYVVKLPNFNDREWHGQKCLLNNFNISAGYLNNSDKIEHQYFEDQSTYFKYNPNVFNIPKNSNLHGYFQNYQYYKQCEDLIIEELTPKKEIVEYNEEVFKKIKEKYKGYEIISLHIRRGDTDLKMYGETPSFLDKNSRYYIYLTNAKKHFEGRKVKFIIFTGGNRIDDNPSSDYVWCKTNFTQEEYIFSDHNNTTINDFTLMYLCDSHILSPISSLSWWVGFLNKRNINKLTIAPKKYYFLNKEMDGGFYPDNFILV